MDFERTPRGGEQVKAHWSRLGMGGAVCGGCGKALPLGSKVWSTAVWLFCDEACAAKWPGHPPLGVAVESSKVLAAVDR